MRASPLVLVLLPACVGAGAGPARDLAIGGPGLGDCSQLHRAFTQWQGNEVAECGPDLTGRLELTPVGNHQLLMRRRFSPPYQVWQVTAAGVIGSLPAPVKAIEEGTTAAFTLVPGTPPRVLVTDPRSSDWHLYLFGHDGLASPQVGSWPQGPAFPSGNGQPWGHQFLGLPEGRLLDRNLGDGSSRIWRFVKTPGSDGTIQIELLSNLAGAPREAFRRGHRLVPLGSGRLLEWLPRPCGGPTGAPISAGDEQRGAACAGTDFNVWTYQLPPEASVGPPTDAFEVQLASSGFWSDVGAGDDIVADDAHLFVWTRGDGRLRSYALDPGAANPLAGPVLHDLTDKKQLVSEDWNPPTQAPAIKHLILILQDGRSFDSYFGHYCLGAPAPGGEALPCAEGPTCCEQMPASIPGAASCAPLDPSTDARRPVATPDCLRSKINDGALDGFALASRPAPCGDPLDFSCAGVGPAAGALALYHRLANRGALADRFFQSYAFAEGEGATVAPDPLVENLLYLVTARFTDPTALRDTPLLTKELARLAVPWAVYAGPTTRARMSVFGVPIFYDPDWYPFRSLEGGELEHDLATGQLPSVAVVIPDSEDAARSEAPGHTFDRAIAFVDNLATSIGASPTYGGDTLVLLTYTTAGGYYDHVAPPSAPPLTVDSSTGGGSSKGGLIHYGPRVPLLVFPPFARVNHVSHVPLEMSSLTVFIEWNWMHGNTLYRATSTADLRRYRDNAASNIGSLIDPARAGIAVPISRE